MAGRLQLEPARLGDVVFPTAVYKVYKSSTAPEANGRRNTPTDPTKCTGPKIVEVDILRHVPFRIPLT